MSTDVQLGPPLILITCADCGLQFQKHLRLKDGFWIDSEKGKRTKHQKDLVHIKIQDRKTRESYCKMGYQCPSCHSVDSVTISFFNCPPIEYTRMQEVNDMIKEMRRRVERFRM